MGSQLVETRSVPWAWHCACWCQLDGCGGASRERVLAYHRLVRGIVSIQETFEQVNVLVYGKYLSAESVIFMDSIFD